MLCMYNVTESIIGTDVFAATIGVRRESPTSCSHFILYVNELKRLIKDICSEDGFLKWLHLLILMGAIVLLSTTRERMMNKLSLMKRFCSEYGMKVNESKTKFLCYTRHTGGQQGYHHRWIGSGAVHSVPTCIWGHPSLPTD